MSDNMADDLKEQIAASVRGELDQYDIGGDDYVGIGDYVEEDMNRYTVSVELVENGGMLVRYGEPIKRAMPQMVRRADTSQAIEAFVKVMTMAITATVEDTKDEAVKKRLARFSEGMKEGLKAFAPKTEDQWVLETRTAVCKTSEDLMAAIEKANQFKAKVEELERSGHRVYGGGCFGGLDYQTAPVATLRGSPAMMA